MGLRPESPSATRSTEWTALLVESGALFVLQRPDADRIVAARRIDPVFADNLARAADAGVRILGRRCSVAWDGIRLGGRVEAGPE
ncbi:MAG TPA: DNA/RNA nuclease SfsA [Longimicrobiales bacterium]|nr:DNA/RNA nuclease SfsA [Longimicrobiales bacterium]